MDILTSFIIFTAQFGLVFGDFCYNSFYTYYSYYCSGYCSGYYGNQYCETSLTVGGIVGIVIGSLVFLAIVIGVIVAICVACTKSAGTTGRVVYPVNTGYAVVQSSAQGQGIFHTAPSAPPYQYSTMMYGAYPQTSSTFAPPPPPVYTSGLNGMDGNQPPIPPKY